MFVTWLRLIALLGVALLTCTGANAQDFRVYTQVFDEQGPPAAAGAGPQQPTQAAFRCLTLFHAGLVYDYVEAVREVIIIDLHSEKPRFTLLNTQQELMATIDRDELDRMLGVADEVRTASFEKVDGTETAESDASRAFNRFQQSPAFKATFDPKSMHLVLASPVLKYEVRCATPPKPAIAERYLKYADTICRLNYVLHPGILLPEPRLKLNENLRSRALIPVNVSLRVELETPIRRTAEHQFRWNLDPTDRKWIAGWELLLKNKNVRKVSLCAISRKFSTGKRARESEIRRPSKNSLIPDCGAELSHVGWGLAAARLSWNE